MVFMSIRRLWDCWRSRVNGECHYDPWERRCLSLLEVRECLIDACEDERCVEKVVMPRGA